MDSQTDNHKPEASSSTSALKLSKNYSAHFKTAANGYRKHFLDSINNGYKCEWEAFKTKCDQRKFQIDQKFQRDVADLRAKAQQDEASLRDHFNARTAEMVQHRKEEVADFIQRFDRDPVAVIMRHEEVAVETKGKEGEKKGDEDVVGQAIAAAAVQSGSIQSQQSTDTAMNQTINVLTPAAMAISTPPAVPAGTDQPHPPSSQTMTPASTPLLAKKSLVTGLHPAYVPRVWRPPPDTPEPGESLGAAQTAATQPQPKPTSGKTVTIPSGSRGRSTCSKNTPEPIPTMHKPELTASYPNTRLTSAQTSFLVQQLRSLRSQPYSRPFRAAVDEVRLGIPTYYKIIKKPMYIALLEFHLKHDKYQSVKAFMEDFEVMAANSRLFNGDKHEITQMAEVMEKEFRQTMEGLPGLRKGEKYGVEGTTCAPIEID